MSTREAAIGVLVKMLEALEDRDRVSAADKLLRSEGIDKATADLATETLVGIMNNTLAKPSDRVNAADKLKTYGSKSRTEHSLERRLAAMTDAELHAIVDAHEIPRRLELDPLLQ